VFFVPFVFNNLEFFFVAFVIFVVITQLGTKETKR